jgi:hypothetical protein
LLEQLPRDRDRPSGYDTEQLPELIVHLRDTSRLCDRPFRFQGPDRPFNVHDGGDRVRTAPNTPEELKCAFRTGFTERDENAIR